MRLQLRSPLISSILSAPPGNLRPGERIASSLAGAGLLAAALSRGGLLRRVVFAAGGLTLLSRGASGFCGMKAAIRGESSLSEGMREQWQRTRSQLGRGAGGIDSLHELYTQELAELAGDAAELDALLAELRRSIEHTEVAKRLQAYATELRSRAEDLRRVVAGSAGSAEHPDQAMSALVKEARKMRQVVGANVRDAALIDSLQRIIHYLIAAWGSAAAYAKALGRNEEAARLSEYADRDKAVDAELSDLATSVVNVHAASQPQGTAAAQARTH